MRVWDERLRKGNIRGVGISLGSARESWGGVGFEYGRCQGLPASSLPDRNLDVFVYVCVCITCSARQASKAQSSPLPSLTSYVYRHQVQYLSTPY